MMTPQIFDTASEREHEKQEKQVKNRVFNKSYVNKIR